MYTDYEESRQEENNQSAGVVGEDPRISNWDWNAYMLYKDAVNRKSNQKNLELFVRQTCVLKLWSTPLWWGCCL
jgi:hypothetical protein